MKRVLTIQDISCIGKCSAGVALPVISAMGIETCVLPTTLLSAHTAFSHVARYDLTGDFAAIEKAWQEEGIRFDAIYSGYLGNVQQIAMVERLWEAFPVKLSQSTGKTVRDNAAHIGSIQGENKVTSPLHIVDPAMADHGRLYAGFDDAYVNAMRDLCRKADVIVPNLTELCLLTGTDYNQVVRNRSYTSLSDTNMTATGPGKQPMQLHQEVSSDSFENDWCHDMVRRAAAAGPAIVVLTGYSFGGRIGALAYDREQDAFYFYVNDRRPGAYPGTGDIFASVLTGALARGLSLADAITLATDFVLQCILETEADPEAVWYGVNFETALPWLCEHMNTDHGRC